MEKPCHENLLNIRQIVDDAKCYQKVRDMRWPNEICCPRCSSSNNIRHGKDDMQPHRQKYLCKDCGRYFDDLTDTIFKGNRQSLSVWIFCLYFMGLNLSNTGYARNPK